MEETNTISSVADLIQIPVQKESKFDYEYQQLCSEMEPHFGKFVWSLPHKHTESKIRRAFEVCKTKKIFTVGYLVTCIKNDKGL